MRPIAMIDTRQSQRLMKGLTMLVFALPVIASVHSHLLAAPSSDLQTGDSRRVTLLNGLCFVIHDYRPF